MKIEERTFAAFALASSRATMLYLSLELICLIGHQALHDVCIVNFMPAVQMYKIKQHHRMFAFPTLACPLYVPALPPCMGVS